MTISISKIKGIQPDVQAKLEAEGIKTSDQLLEHAQTSKQRSELANKVGSTPNLLRELANRADLMRLKGIGGDVSNLLEDAGVNSCRELQNRSANDLHKTLSDLNAQKKIAHRIPTVDQIQEWISQSKNLSRTSAE